MARETNEDLGRSFSAAELGALAHLYRAEVYRSTLWRTRLDTTTNWSVVTLGIAISVSFSSLDAPSLPLLLVGFLIIFFLTLEARRYRYFNVWRARARWFETRFYAPMLKHGKLDDGSQWQNVLARDYESPRYHISYLRAVGRHKAADLRHQRDQRGLPQIGALACHVGTGQHMDRGLRRQLRVVGHKGLFGQRQLDDRVAARQDRNPRPLIDDRADIAVGQRHLG